MGMDWGCGARGATAGTCPSNDHCGYQKGESVAIASAGTVRGGSRRWKRSTGHRSEARHPTQSRKSQCRTTAGFKCLSRGETHVLEKTTHLNAIRAVGAMQQ